MKGFLLDENLPTRLRFSPGLPVVSASVVGRHATDSDLWEFARKHELAIVTKDADFSERIITRSPPPWVVHLRFGNLRRDEFHARLACFWPQIEALLASHKLVGVYVDRLEGVG